MARQNISVATTCNCTSLRKASRRISQLYDAVLAPAGVKSTQYAILAELNRPRDAPLTMQELAGNMVMDRSTLGHNLRPLERDGLIAFVVSADDRRCRFVKLTAAGQRLFQKATPYWLEAQSQFELAFSPKTSSDMRKLLHSIAATQFDHAAASA